MVLVMVWVLFLLMVPCGGGGTLRQPVRRSGARIYFRNNTVPDAGASPTTTTLDQPSPTSDSSTAAASTYSGAIPSASLSSRTSSVHTSQMRTTSPYTTLPAGSPTAGGASTTAEGGGQPPRHTSTVAASSSGGGDPTSSGELGGASGDGGEPLAPLPSAVVSVDTPGRTTTAPSSHQDRQTLPTSLGPSPETALPILSTPSEQIPGPYTTNPAGTSAQSLTVPAQPDLTGLPPAANIDKQVEEGALETPTPPPTIPGEPYMGLESPAAPTPLSLTTGDLSTPASTREPEYPPTLIPSQTITENSAASTSQARTGALPTTTPLQAYTETISTSTSIEEPGDSPTLPSLQAVTGNSPTRTRTAELDRLLSPTSPRTTTEHSRISGSASATEPERSPRPAHFEPTIENLPGPASTSEPEGSPTFAQSATEPSSTSERGQAWTTSSGKHSTTFAFSAATTEREVEATSEESRPEDDALSGGSTDNPSPAQQATTAGITTGAVAVALAMGVVVFRLVGRHNRRRQQSRRRRMSTASSQSSLEIRCIGIGGDSLERAACV